MTPDLAAVVAKVLAECALRRHFGRDYTTMSTLHPDAVQAYREMYLAQGREDAAEVTNALTTALTRMADEWDQRATKGIHRDDFNSSLLTWSSAAKELRAAIPESLGAGENQGGTEPRCSNCGAKPGEPVTCSWCPDDVLNPPEALDAGE